MAEAERTERIRVSYIIGSLALGGAETQLVRLVNGLDRNHFQPSIVCLTRGGELEARLAADVSVIKAVLPTASSGVIKNRAFLAAHILGTLVRGLRAQRPDIVHGYLPAAYVLGGIAAWVLRVPVIIAGRRGLTTVGDFRTSRWRALARLANRVIDVHICNSSAVRQWAVKHEGIKVAKTRVIHNGIDIPERTPRPVLPAEWATEGVKAGMVANLIPYKGHANLLRSVQRVVQRHPAFKLVLIGEGREREAIARDIQNLGIARNVVLAGHVIDASRYLPAFDFTVLASSEEGFPNALMESMASGVPVVATSVGGVTELVQDGLHGRLATFGDIHAMSEAISWMIEHPDERHQMGEAGKQRIAAEFSTRRMIDATEAVYRDLLGRSAMATASRGPARST